MPQDNVLLRERAKEETEKKNSNNSKDFGSVITKLSIDRIYLVEISDFTPYTGSK